MSDNPFRHAGDLPDAAAQPPPLGRSLITVIGINKYVEQDALTNAREDAEDVLKLFKRCGFEELAEAPSLFDEQATRSAIESLVLEQLPPALRPDDSLVLFYAGHGATTKSTAPDPEDAGKMKDRYTGYLIPVGARRQKPSDWLQLDPFLEAVSNLPARHVLVILDACKSGFALDRYKRRGDEGQPSGTIDELAARVSRRVVTSATHEQTAMDGGGGDNSLFTETLVDAVENLRADHNGDGYVTTTELFSYVRQQVGDTALRVHHVKQTPDYGYLPGDGSGELVLSLRGDTYNRLRADENLKVADHIYQLGWLSGDGKRFASAARYYTEALKLAALGKMPLPAARLGLGKALLAQGQAAEAATTLAELVQDEGDAAPAEARFSLGLARAKLGQYAPAAEALRAWLKLQPDSVDAAWVGAYTDWLAPPGVPAGGRKLALLVGINQYRWTRAFELKGSVNDVKKLMQPALLEHGGFEAENVTVLTNAQATHERFLQELHRLQQTTTAHDAILVYFSGHSIPPHQARMLGEGLANDVYLILHDTDEDSGKLTNGVTAAELHQLMQSIPAGNTTLILDTHASEPLMELARREGTYALILASDTAEVAYEWQVVVGGKKVPCGMLTGALYQSLLAADAQKLTYGEWITAAIRITEEATSNPLLYKRRQTPYFSGIEKLRVFGPDDIYGSAFEFTQRQDWPELPLDELTKLYAIFSHTLTVLHPQGHAAFGRAFLSKGAYAKGIAALQTAVAQAGDALPANWMTLASAQFQADQHAAALATLRRYAPLAAPADGAALTELASLLEKLATERKHALLVGIDRHKSKSVPTLKGACNDVATMKQVLVQRWGFQADDVKTLVDDQATRATVVAGFEHLLESARSEPALFFFAGRGSHDQDGAPTIVPYDGRQKDVPDIGLGDLAKAAAREPTNLVAILDASFSGRAPKYERTLEADRRTPIAPRFATQDERVAYMNALQLGFATIWQDLEMLGWPASAGLEPEATEDRRNWMGVETEAKLGQGAEQVHGTLTGALYAILDRADAARESYGELERDLQKALRGILVKVAEAARGQVILTNQITLPRARELIQHLMAGPDEQRAREIIAGLQEVITRREQQGDYWPEGRLNLGIAYACLGEYQDAERWLDEAVDMFRRPSNIGRSKFMAA